MSTELSRQLNRKWFSILTSVEQGSAVDPKVRAAENIINKLMNGIDNRNYAFDLESEEEKQLILGADANLQNRNLQVLITLDLATIQYTDDAAEELVSYFKEMFLDYYYYAKRQTA